MPIYNPGTNTFDIQTTCRECKSVKVVNVNADDYKAWLKGGLIQNVMPYLSADERELLISGVCGECFDKMFPPED
jgi:hypothetical protein